MNKVVKIFINKELELLKIYSELVVVYKYINDHWTVDFVVKISIKYRLTEIAPEYHKYPKQNILSL